MNPGALNKRVTLQQPTREASTGPVARVTGYADVATVWAGGRPLRADEASRALGEAQIGAYEVAIRRPVEVTEDEETTEVVPDRTWRLTFTEAGETRTLEVAAVLDGTPKAPSVHFWRLACTEVRR